MSVSDAQSRAIAHGTGSAMVLAGPGSGKTLVITQRTKYLIEERKVKPREILVITFTRAAAKEMQERFQKICSASGVTFGTFHAVFFTILKYAYHFTSANIMSEDTKYQMLRQLWSRYAKDSQGDQEMLAGLASEISAVKNEGVSLENYYARSCSDEVFREIYNRYEEMHRRERLLDFDDMLTASYELLKQRPDILAAWQKRWSYILVDEFQDINLLQYQILKLLAAPDYNLFIVGDDDQSIYRFRGAKPEIMLNFPKDFPQAKTILLDQNFRSTASVIEGAARVIEKNKHRFSKKIRPVREKGAPIEVKEFRNPEHESLYLAKCIQNSLRQGTPYQEIAVLVRTNQGAGPFAERLMEFNIPFAIRDSLPNIYEHWIAKDLFAYLHLAHEGLDRAEFLQVMNRPKRYISRECIDGPVLSFERLASCYQDRDWMLDRLDRMKTDLEILKKLPPYAAVNYIRLGMHYEDFLKEYAAARRLKQEDLLNVLDEIQQGARPYRTVEEWYAHLDEYEKMLEETKKAGTKDSEAIVIATLHGSKGLEFSEVFLPDVNEGVLPHRRASIEADIEEERRLFYVGMTRAKNQLHIFYTRERYGRASEPSGFLDVFLT